MAGLWFVLAKGDPAAWLVGVPTVMFAVWARLRLSPPEYGSISVTGAMRFAGFFLIESLRGGIDVAARTLRPELRINPGHIRYQCRLPSGRPRVLFASCVNLLPGSLLVDLRGPQLLIHVLDTNAQPETELSKLETLIAALFTLEREPAHV